MARSPKFIKHLSIGSVAPGLVLMGVVLLCRAAGVLEPWELLAFDLALRARWTEPMDERVVIVGIDEADLGSFEHYPMSDRQLSKIIQTLQSFQPRVIGVDYVRDRYMPPGVDDLRQTFATSSNVIGIEKVLPDRNGLGIQGHDALPSDRVGFVDTILDRGGFVRRSLLGTHPLVGDYRFSFTVRITELFLQADGIELRNGIDDPVAMRFGRTEFQRVRRNSGSYIRTDANGNQVLINFRQSRQPFRILSWRQVESGQVDPSWFRDRIVLVGSMALSEKDVINSNAIQGGTPGLIYGVELQAHAISQMISAVLDQRPLLKTWPDIAEYSWMMGWGLIGILLGRFRLTPTRYMVWMTGLALLLVGISYGAILMTWWIPIVPPLALFLLNALVLDGFYLYDRGLRARIDDRQQVIENTFNAIHNGPLQTLGQLQRTVESQALNPTQVSADLDHLNQEIRAIYESVRQETLGAKPVFMLGSDRVIALDTSLDKVLFEIYRETWKRDFPYFQEIKVKVVSFEALDETYLSLDQKRELCRFFEEALCNVGKYAAQAKRVTIRCGQSGGENFVQVIDNGQPVIAAEKKHGRGTQQAIQLAKNLGGTYQRRPHQPQGTLCRLSWPVKPKAWWQRLLFQ